MCSDLSFAILGQFWRKLPAEACCSALIELPHLIGIHERYTGALIMIIARDFERIRGSTTWQDTLAAADAGDIPPSVLAMLLRRLSL